MTPIAVLPRRRGFRDVSASEGFEAMGAFLEVWRRLRLLFRRSDLNRDLEEEIQAHLELERDENIRAGMSPSEARQAALRTFGNVSLAREATAEVWGFPTLESFLRDLRYAFRKIAAQPLYAVIVVVTLGLCIGSNTAVFNLLDTILLRPLAVPEPDRLVSLYHRSREGEGRFETTSYPDFLHYRDHNDVLSGLAAFGRVPTLLRKAGGVEEIYAELVSPGYFSLLGVRPRLGRVFSSEDEPTAVAVLSEGFWKTHFGGDPAVLGRTLQIYESTPTVIGVIPAAFQGVVLDWGRPPDVWLLLESFQQSVAGLSSENDMLTNPRLDWLLLVGSLREGVTRLQAQANLESLNTRLVETRPKRWRDRRVALLPTSQARFWPAYRPGIVTQLSLFMLAVGLVLAVACMNLTNLALSQATKRRREIALRMALGAGRLRLIRQLVCESLPLALMGGGLGILLAEGIHRLILSFPKPFGITLAIDSPVHLRVVVFAILVSGAVAGICGLLPALHATRLNLVAGLQMAVPSARLAGMRVSRLMTTGQIAAALMLLITGGLLFRALRDAGALEVARDPDKLLVAQPNLLGAGLSGDDSGPLFRELLERIRALPMIESAALARTVPLRDGVTRAEIEINPGASDETMEVYMNVVSPGFFETMGMPILKGRGFNEKDKAEGTTIAVVNEQMAVRLWTGGNALGERIRPRSPGAAPEAVVVGIVHDGGRQLSVREKPGPCFYVVYGDKSRGYMRLLARFRGPREAAAAAIRDECRRLHSGLAPPLILTMSESLSNTLSPERVASLLFNAMALLATMVAIVGLYGVISFSVSRRTREIGVRLSVGACGRDIRTWIMKEGLILLVVGVPLGLAGAMALTRWMQSRFHGVRDADTLVYILAVLCLGVAVLIASYLPARRAARVDPMTALRHE